MQPKYENTLPSLLMENAARYGTRTALREKEFGIWQSFSWEEHLQAVAEFAAGLRTLGFGVGDVLVLIGDNRPEWIWAQLAAQTLGGMSLGLYQDSPAEEVKYIFELSRAKVVVAEDQEQVDKILTILPDLPDLRHLVYHDPRGLGNYAEKELLDFQALREKGKATADRFGDWVKERSPDEACVILTTSGTTGRPKLAMLSHRNLLAMAWNLGVVDPKKETDQFVSFLPLAWVGEQMMAVASALLFGFTVNFPEETETVSENIREIGPHLIFSPPRVWENMAASVKVKIMETSRFKRFLYNRLHPVGERYADARMKGKTPGVGLRLAYVLADALLFRCLRDRLGFSNVRSASTGGAALGPDTFRFFHAMGVNLKQIYGQTEISGISCIHRDGAVDFDTVGEPIPETEIAISEQGEILSKSPAVFLGYFRNEEATRETLENGWLRSGDAGYFKENGQLVIIDRLKDVMQLRNGERFSPQFMENKLKFSPYIREAVVLGSGQEYLAAIVCVDQEIVGRWAEQQMITYTTYQDLAAKEEVYALIGREIGAINADLPRATRIRRFTLLFKELDADDGELTRTRKVRRGVVNERYAPLIQALFEDKDQVTLAAKITYQDGREREMCGTLRLAEADTSGAE